MITESNIGAVLIGGLRDAAGTYTKVEERRGKLSTSGRFAVWYSEKFRIWCISHIASTYHITYAARLDAALTLLNDIEASPDRWWAEVTADMPNPLKYRKQRAELIATLKAKREVL